MSDAIWVLLKVKRLEYNTVERLIERLVRYNKKVIFSGNIPKIEIKDVKKSQNLIKYFFEQEGDSAIWFENRLSYFISIMKNKHLLKWMTSDNEYILISISDIYLKYIDDPDEPFYEEQKERRDRNTKEFLNALKIICDVLQPEYGWGDVDSLLEDRPFDYRDTGNLIFIYNPEIVKNIGEKKILTAPIKYKVKLANSGYLLMPAVLYGYDLKLREKVRKHLFGNKK